MFVRGSQQHGRQLGAVLIAKSPDLRLEQPQPQHRRHHVLIETSRAEVDVAFEIAYRAD